MPQPEPAEKSPLPQGSVGETSASSLDRTAMPASGVTPSLQHCVPTIPDHELIRRIGSGSYGEVWLARSVVGTYRAVKIVFSAQFEDDRPYDREFKGIQKFEPVSRSHDGLVDILQIGRNDQIGCFYCVMELADDAGPKRRDGVVECCSNGKATDAQCGAPTGRDSGTPGSLHSNTPTIQHSVSSYTAKTLRNELRRRGRLPMNECLAVGLTLTSALEHLHKNELVHRDIKPSNIIFVNGVPKLADIGLVADMSDAKSFVGTLGYIPPEGPGTPQADLYGLGKVLYEMSTGRDRQDFPQLPADLREFPSPDALVEFNEIVLRACEAEPGRRYQSAAEMRADLELLQRGKSVKRKRTLHQVWRVGKQIGLASSTLAGVAVVAAMLFHQFKRPDFPGDGPPSTNMEANVLCTKAMLIVRGDNYAAFPEAYTNFQKAIALDTHFARPYIGLLELHLVENNPAVGNLTPELVGAIAHKLMELAPNLAATHCAQSVVACSDWDYPRAEKSALQAISADPNYVMARIFYGFMLTHWGRCTEGREQLRICQGLAPSKVTLYRMMGHTYYVERDFTNAMAWYRKALELEPHHGPAYHFIGEAYRATGDYSNALENLEKGEIIYRGNELELRRSFDGLRRALRQGGIQSYWAEEWKRTEKELGRDFYWKAVIQVHLRHTEAAFQWLNRSYAAHERPGIETSLIYLLFDAHWDGVRDDPRFKELLEKVGFTKAARPPK